jgi:hypothetical protein
VIEASHRRGRLATAMTTLFTPNTGGGTMKLVDMGAHEGPRSSSPWAAR